MSASPLDYAAIAKQYGAVSSSQPGVDYGAIAKQYGAIDSQPVQPQQQTPDTGISGSLRRTLSIPGAIGKAFIEGPQNSDEQKSYTLGGPGALGIDRLVAQPVGNEVRQAQQASAQAKAAAKPGFGDPGNTGHPLWDQTLGRFFDLPFVYGGDKPTNLNFQGDPNAGHMAQMHTIGAAPLVGPLASDITQRFLSGDTSGASTDLATVVGGQAALRAAPQAIRDVLPSKAKAGDLFKEASAAAGDQPVDLTEPGNRALKIRELSEAGGQQPKVIRDFIRRTTDPSQGPLTYDEARDFYSNATRISAEEAQRLTPVMRYQLQQFTRELGQSIGDAAEQKGVGPQYQGAMKQYRQAMKLQDFQDFLKQGAIKTGVGAIGGAAGAYGLKKIIESALGK